MLKKISFKGVLLGAIADVGGSNIWSIIAVMYLFSNYHILSLPQNQQANRLQSLMAHDPILFFLNMLVGGGFSILGGYIAARIAKHDELLHGTLSSFLCVLFSFLALGSAPIYVVLIAIIGNPLLGFIGGYLRLWEQKRKGKKKMQIDI